MKKSQLFISFVKPDFKVIQSKRVFDKAGTCIFAGAFFDFQISKELSFKKMRFEQFTD